MSSRPYYALIVLAVILAAGLALTGSQQPKSPLPQPVKLAPRPEVFVAAVVRPRALDELRKRVPPALASQKPFVDHHALLKAAYSMSSAGVGNPLLYAKSAGPASSTIGVVVQREFQDGPAQELATTGVLPSTVGFEEFTAIVQSEPWSEESAFSWPTGCGVDHSTGEIYPEPPSVDYPQLAQPEEPVRSAVNWWGILRVYAEVTETFSVFSFRFSVLGF